MSRPEIPDYLLDGYEADEGYMVTPGPVCCGVCHEMIPSDTAWYWSREKMRWDHSTVEKPCIDVYEKEFGPAPTFSESLTRQIDRAEADIG